MSEPKILVHVGYHKTGTTALQTHFFTDPEGPFLVPPSEPRHALVERFVVPQPFTFDPEATRRHYDTFLRQAARTGKCAVFSHERFSGYPASGGFDSKTVAQRLQSTLPGAHILIVFREQVSSILSFYSQYVSDGGDQSLKSYLRRRERALQRNPSFSPEFYRYDRLFRYYQKLFGRDRVCGLAFEQFRKDPDAFIAQLCAFVGVDVPDASLGQVNTKRSALVQSCQRHLNRYFSDNQLSHGGLFAIPGFTKRFGIISNKLGAVVPKGIDRSIEARMRRHVEAEFDGAFAESNAVLAELTSIDFTAYGYQVPLPCKS